MKIKNSLLAVLLLFCNAAVFPQTKEFTDIKGFYVRDVGAIVDDNVVKGYYFFYVVEKADKKNDNYLLQVLDENLREVNSVNITRPASYVLLESVWNGTAFAFVFMDYKDKLIEFLSYDKTCKQLGSKKLTDLKNRELYAYAASVGTGEENSTQTIHAIENKGFLRITPVKNDKMGYDVEMLSNEMKSLWKTGSSETDKNVLLASLIDISPTKALLQIASRPGNTSKDVTFRLQCLDLEKGKQTFDMPLNDQKYNLGAPSASFDDNGNIVLLGEYYELKDKTISGKSLGFYGEVMAPDGQAKTKKFISWATDISKVIPVTAKGKIDNEAYVFFHKIIRLKDGKIMAIGEQYKKAASGGGIAMRVLAGATGGSSNASVVDLVILNMMVFEFDADFNLKAAQIFEKDKSKVNLPGGAMVSPSELARYADFNGSFDYVYTQMSNDGSGFTASYVNYDREKGEKPKNVAGTIIYSDGKYTEDKFPLTVGKTSYSIYPAKPGYIMILEYAKKTKTLSLRLEKFNY